MSDVARIHTEAETALFEAFEAANLAGGERATALDLLRSEGLPTRKVESFHYTDLRARLRGDFRVTGAPSNDDAKAAGAKFPRLAADASVLHFRDGHLVDMGEAAPEGVTVSHDLPAAFEVAGQDDTVVALNNAFAQGGVSIAVEAGAQVPRAIGLASTPTAENAVAATRVAISVGEGASANFVERGVGPDGMHYLSSSAVSLQIADGATVGYILSNEEGDAAQRLARLSVNLGEKSTLNLFVLNAGSALTRQELNFTMAGEGAALVINGINLVGDAHLGKGAHIDVTSRIDHHVPGCTAEETFRNVCTDSGTGVFQGQINVAQAAQQTDARMACNTLLLSDDCEFNAKPELEIFADDVQCAHGATVTDLEESYLFYLRSRGIGEAQARRMLIKAFVAEVMEDMDEEIAGALEDRIDGWMERHV